MSSDTSNPRDDMIDLLKSKRPAAQAVHGGVNANGSNLSSLFTEEKYDEILNFLETGTAARPPVVDEPLVVKGKPDESGLITQAKSGVMAGQFNNEEIGVIEAWINSLSDD